MLHKEALSAHIVTVESDLFMQLETFAFTCSFCTVPPFRLNTSNLLWAAQSLSEPGRPLKPEILFHWDALCQGNPVIIQVVTPGGRAEQNGVKAG